MYKARMLDSNEVQSALSQLNCLSRDFPGLIDIYFKVTSIQRPVALIYKARMLDSDEVQSALSQINCLSRDFPGLIDIYFKVTNVQRPWGWGNGVMACDKAFVISLMKTCKCD